MTAMLVWGSTSLIPDESSSVGFSIEAVAEGTGWGNPESVVTAIKSRLQDGSLAEVTSFDNRQATVRIRVSSNSYDGLAAGEQALVGETNVPGYNTLTWTPNRLLAKPTVFDVVYSTLAFEFDDLAETKRGEATLWRTFVATLECLPFGRDPFATTVPANSGVAPPVTPTTVLIDACTSSTGWASTVDGLSPAAPTTSGTALYRAAPAATFPGQVSAYTIALARTGTIDLTTTRILTVDWRSDSYSVPPSVNIWTAGVPVQAPPIASEVSSTAGFTRTKYQVPPTFPTTATAISFLFSSVFTGQAAYVDNVERTNVAPMSGTSRQQYRTLEIGGSARTRAALSITAPAGQTLGDLTLLYTCSGGTGLQPPLRRWRASSASVSLDATTLSGSRNSLGDLMTFLIPASKFREAAHDLMLRMRASTAGPYTIYWAAQLVSSGGTDIAETPLAVSGSTVITFPAANTWQTSEVGRPQLPTVPVAADSTHMIRLGIQASSAVVELDEGWLFDLDNGVLSWVNTTGLTRLEVRTADLTNPEPSYWGGTADGGGAVGMIRADWRVLSWGEHVIEPGLTTASTTTSGTDASSCSATFYTTYLHNATGEAAA